MICMVGTYEIRRGTEPVGTATVDRQGLYYKFSCRCHISGEGMRRIVVDCGDVREDLGICVPVDGAFGLEKKIPCKRFGEGKPAFFLLPKYPDIYGKFVPIYPDEPFAYMARLKDAYLQVREGQPGIVIRE